MHPTTSTLVLCSRVILQADQCSPRPMHRRCDVRWETVAVMQAAHLHGAPAHRLPAAARNAACAPRLLAASTARAFSLRATWQFHTECTPPQMRQQTAQPLARVLAHPFPLSHSHRRWPAPMLRRSRTLAHRTANPDSNEYNSQGEQQDQSDNPEEEETLLGRDTRDGDGEAQAQKQARSHSRVLSRSRSGKEAYDDYKCNLRDRKANSQKYLILTRPDHGAAAAAHDDNDPQFSALGDVDAGPHTLSGVVAEI
ncbi:hypothetical protein CONPUDRAFT_166841 [Coniophora puteana RWD-64-598 SS2]|uniref:Uncharacterized protein n=1 Tax=Coniophora puteana (strain RWD-64-598) TaxID=741705 RepID=A0A5M3MIR6_CONPW|nr:uncharacterized protein CONPUDRAFT_166841 [Coniophora puteana RWD-64-598 SS2]EIW79003.1 hypothetical protein CONPUDRAFT_166841 [Coniophora puteana RWD-64-598 SS2]